jgi:hypothetical protein
VIPTSSRTSCRKARRTSTGWTGSWSDPKETLAILKKEYSELEGMDLARFTFEMDDAIGEIFELVSTVLGQPAHS